MAETVVAVLIFTLVGTAALTGLSATLNVGSKAESQAAAERLGRNQMEYLFSLDYRQPPATYPAVSAPPGYAVSAVAEGLVLNDPNIEKVVVTVSRDGRAVLVLETLRLME